MYIEADCSDVKNVGSASRIFRDILKAEDDYCGSHVQTRLLPSKYTLPIPTNRTQNPEEALEGSLLLFFTMNKTDFHPITPPDIIPSMLAESEGPWKSHLKEAFCRSVEPFGEVFDTITKPRELYRVETEQGEVRLQTQQVDFDDPINRPPTCWR